MEIIDLVSCFNSSSSNNLIHMVNFPTWIPNCDCHSPPPLDLFISTDASICSTVVFLPLGNSDHVVASDSINFLSNLKGNKWFLCPLPHYNGGT